MLTSLLLAATLAVDPQPSLPKVLAFVDARAQVMLMQATCKFPAGMSVGDILKQHGEANARAEAALAAVYSEAKIDPKEWTLDLSDIERPKFVRVKKP